MCQTVVKMCSTFCFLFSQFDSHYIIQNKADHNYSVRFLIKQVAAFHFIKMSFFSPRSAPTDEGRYNLRTSDSPQSIDNTTLNDNDPIDQIDLDEEMDDAASSKYDEKYRNERNAIHDAQSVRYTAYSFTAKQDSGDSIVNELRNVGVTVLSLETLSTSKLIQYMDAVTKMRIGDATDEKCMLYTDRMGRVFNVVISVSVESSRMYMTLRMNFIKFLNRCFPFKLGRGRRAIRTMERHSSSLFRLECNSIHSFSSSSHCFIFI